MSDLLFTGSAWKEYVYWTEQGGKSLKKLNDLIREIQRTPFEGTGRPEPLSGDLAGMWSRRIDQCHRLIYRVEDDTIEIIQCKGHYDDK